MINLTYVNSAGTEKALRTDKIMISSGSVHGREWTPSVTEYDIGEKVEYWKKSAYAFNLTIVVRGSRAERLKTLDELCDLFEYDIANNSPGKLYYGSWYCECFIKKVEYSQGDLPTWFNQDVTVYVPSATWYKETKFTISKQDESESDVKYPTLYPFTYPLSGRSTQINNDNFMECDFMIKAYGPTTSVDIEIAGHQYKVDHAVEEGQYLCIDSRTSQAADKRCYVVQSDGSTVNCYNDRDSGSSLFAKIPTGISEVSYNRNYGIDITLFKGRSEPKWNQ